jgi:hypothetical protein
MKIRTSTSIIAACVLVLLVPLSAGAKDKKKKDSQRGMLESMQSVPCGVKQGGLNGLGSVFGTFLAGVLLGLAEAASVLFIGGAYREVVGLILFVLVLLIRPQGLFGRNR